MGWSAVPPAAGSAVEAAAIMEVRAAIIERRRGTGRGAQAGLGDPPAVAAGDICEAATIDAYRRRIEDLFGLFLNVNAPGQRWTKQAIMQAALGAGRGDWTNVPARAGGLAEGADLPPGTLLFAEHLSDMKAVLDLLYLLPLGEKEGRMYCVSEGAGWTWSAEPFSIYETAGASGGYEGGPVGTERGMSAPYDLVYEPIGDVQVTAVKAKGRMRGSDAGLTVKLISFSGADMTDPPPSDREWRAQMRIGNERPADSPRAGDSEAFYTSTLADDGTHYEDSTATGQSWRQVYVNDRWEETLPAPEREEWPFWLTFILEDYRDVMTDYAVEAAGTGQELQMWAGSVWMPVDSAWAEAEFEYLDR